jgi:hypothetical protein
MVWRRRDLTLATSLIARNDNGVSIGYSSIENNQPILVSGNGSAGETLLVLNNATFNNVTQFTVSGINVWGSIVGSVPGSSSTQGFKLWSHGGVLALNYPGATSTTPSGFNDSGTIVGFYSTGGQQQNGFIYQNGQWATLNFPNAMSTVLASRHHQFGNDYWERAGERFFNRVYLLAGRVQNHFCSEGGGRFGQAS